MKEFKKVLENNESLKKIDRFVFENIVEKVIVGKYMKIIIVIHIN